MWEDIVIEDGWVLVPYEWMFPLGSTLDMNYEKGETENEHLRDRR